VQLSNAKRTLAIVGVGSMAAALTVLGTGSAMAASSPHSECGHVSIEHSVDNGASWTTNGRMDGDHMPATVQVRLTGNVEDGCSYPVSLASYSAEGPTWQTSGTQAFLGWDTTTLDSKQPTATLDVSRTAPTCFGQIDLYGNGTKYDGTTGALPHYPDSATPTNLITAWNGGKACSATPTPPATPVNSATPTPSATPQPTKSAPAVDSTASPAPSSSTAPVGTPQVPPTSTKPTGNLAETGGNSTETTVIGGAAAALLVIGGGAVAVTRRKRAGAN
jgi:LPXTG-motif cell wall-anchored protein